MAQANLSAQRVIRASAKAIDYVASRRGTNAAVANGRNVQEMLQQLRSLAIFAVAESGIGAVVTVTSEEAFWLVEAYEDLDARQISDITKVTETPANTHETGSALGRQVARTHANSWESYDG